MAGKNNNSEEPLEKQLWKAADKLRKNIDAAFHDGRTYTADQIRFVNYIVDHLTRNGTLDPGPLYDRPFTDIHYAGPDGIFTDAQPDDLLAIVAGVNESIAFSDHKGLDT